MLFWEWLRQVVADIHLNIYLLDVKVFRYYEIVDVMVPYLNMLCFGMINEILDEVYCAL